MPRARACREREYKPTAIERMAVSTDCGERMAGPPCATTSCRCRAGRLTLWAPATNSRAFPPPAAIEALVESVARSRLTANGVTGRVDVIPRVNGPPKLLSDAWISRRTPAWAARGARSGRTPAMLSRWDRSSGSTDLTAAHCCRCSTHPWSSSSTADRSERKAQGPCCPRR